ncbi:hypothetical protein SH449x_004479 [Pirellulaceae bacterium SH449]
MARIRTIKPEFWADGRSINASTSYRNRARSHTSRGEEQKLSDGLESMAISLAGELHPLTPTSEEAALWS